MAIKWLDLLAEADSSGGGFEPLPVGEYSIVIDSAEHTTTQGGKSMFKTKMKVQGGPHDGRFVWNQFVISPESPKAIGFFFSQMKALGLGQEFFESQPDEQVLANSLVGRTANVTLGQREWQGQVRNEVKSIKPATGNAPTVAAAPSTPAPPAAPGTGASASPVAPF